MASNLATDKLDAGVRDSVDYFTLPTLPGAVTADNEYVTPSGIGMAVNSATYDPLVRDFLRFALERYPAEVAASGALFDLVPNGSAVVAPRHAYYGTIAQLVEPRRRNEAGQHEIAQFVELLLLGGREHGDPPARCLFFEEAILPNLRSRPRKESMAA